MDVESNGGNDHFEARDLNKVQEYEEDLNDEGGDIVLEKGEAAEDDREADLNQENGEHEVGNGIKDADVEVEQEVNVEDNDAVDQQNILDEGKEDLKNEDEENDELVSGVDKEMPEEFETGSDGGNVNEERELVDEEQINNVNRITSDEQDEENILQEDNLQEDKKESSDLEPEKNVEDISHEAEIEILVDDGTQEKEGDHHLSDEAGDNENTDEQRRETDLDEDATEENDNAKEVPDMNNEPAALKKEIQKDVDDNDNEVQSDKTQKKLPVSAKPKAGSVKNSIAKFNSEAKQVSLGFCSVV